MQRYLMMTRLLFVLSAAVFAMTARAVSLTDNAWQAADSDFSGSVTNEAHWALGHVPTTLERMKVWNLSADYTVTFPKGAYTNAAALRLGARHGRAVTLDGTGSIWVVPGSSDGTTEIHDTYPFSLFSYIDSNTDSSPAFGFITEKATGEYPTHAVAELSDFKITVTGSASDPTMVFDGGTYDFRDPLDSAWTSSTKPLLQIGGGTGSATGKYYFTFRNNVTLRACRVGIQAAGAKGGRTVFDGGNYYFDALSMPDGTRDYANQYASVSDTILTNGAVMSAASVNMAHRTNKEVNLCLTGEGTRLETRGGFTAGSAGISHVDVLDGAELLSAGGATFLSGTGTNRTRIVNAKLTAVGTVTIGNCSDSTKLDKTLSTFAVTNSTFGTAGTLSVGNVANVTIAGGASKVFMNALTYNDVDCRSKMTVSGGETVVTNNVVLDSGYPELVLAGGTNTVGRYITVGKGGGKYGTLTVSGGLLINNFAAGESFASDNVACTIYLGEGANAKGILNVTGGEARFYNIYAGIWGGGGKGEINVSGGKLCIRQDLRLGCYAFAGYEHTLTQTGGEIYAPIDLESLGQTANALARVKLNGGKVTCKSFQAGKASPLRESSSTGNVAFEADGGTIVALQNSTTFFRYFNSAEIKAGGLTIDTAGHSITIDQNFTGTGTLTLTGGGTVTFTAGNAVAGPIRVIGGTKVVFSGVEPGGLTLGDATSTAVLALAAGTPVAVNGDFTISNLTLTVSGLTVGTTVDVFTVTGSIDAETRAIWADYNIPDVPSTVAYDPEIVEKDGTKHMRLVVREPKDIPIDVPAETQETHATNIAYSVNDRLGVTVGEGGEARMEGVVGKGWLIKDGLGTMTLANSVSRLFNGIKFRLGTLMLDYPEADAEIDCPFYLDAAESTNKLTFTAKKAVRFTDFQIGGQGAVKIATAAPIDFALPSATWSPVAGKCTVEEGDVAFRCTAASQGQWGFNNDVAVGVTGKGGTLSKRAKLTIDNFNFAGNMTLASYLGTDDSLEEVTLVTSNSTVSGVIRLTEFATTPNLRTSVLAYNTTFSAGNQYLNHYGKTPVPPRVKLYGGSRMIGNLDVRGNCDVLFDESTLSGAITYCANFLFTNNYTFANGATCSPSTIKSGWSGAYTYPPQIYLTFDDSTFSGMGGDFGYHDPHLDPKDPTLCSNNPWVTVRAKGTGVKLSVPADTTYTWSFRLEDSPDGAGGFVKKGEGTLRVLKARNRDYETYSDDFSFAQTGVTRVEAGVLDLDGNAWTDATLGGGAGVFSNGTVTAVRIVPTFADGVCTAQPRLASDCTLSSGRVKVDVSGAGLEPDTQFVALAYAGTAPDVSKWRLAGESNLRARFTASAGTVTASVIRKPGSVFILR